MTIFYLEALVVIALALSILMAFAWVVRQRTGNSGWVDTIWTLAVGLVGAGGALWPVGGEAPNIRQWLVAALVVIWSLRLGLHIAIRAAGMSDDPRYAAFAKDWGPNTHGGCSSSCKTRSLAPSRWCLRSLLQRDSPQASCDGRTCWVR
jgi:steroid 5-alpha reductase family enzyme